jgi:hypothetical protein
LGVERFARGRFARISLLARLVPRRGKKSLTIDWGAPSEIGARQNLAPGARIGQFVPVKRQILPGRRQDLPSAA